MLVFTSCTNNYIPKARVLASTLKSFHPDWTFCLLLGENPPDSFVLENEPFDRIMTFDQLGIPNYHAWLFRHRVVEICTAAKGPALYHFLEHEEHEKVIYLDPDIMVCNSLSSLEKMLDEHDLLLTPHQLAPQETPQGVIDNEICALQHGTFNLGFVAAARRGDGINFATWWRDRLMHYCYDDIPRGLFTDQRWCDLAPAFFSGLCIVRDPGCNAASWNLTDRTITRSEDGTFLANSTPLRFYHFTGFDSGAGDSMTARYSKNMPAVQELWELYREKLMQSGHAELGKLRWTYMTFNDGTAITDPMRLLYRDRGDLQSSFPDPFTRPGFLDWYLAEEKNFNPSKIKRIRRKAFVISRKIKDMLDQHGGFPRGIPGLAIEGRELIQKYGIKGTLKRIRHYKPKSLPEFENLPLLCDIFTQPEHALFRLLNQTNKPVCFFEHDWGGGADAYCQKRVASFLDHGQAVIQLRYVRAGHIEMTVSLGKERFCAIVTDLNELTDRRFPCINHIIINELAGWYYKKYDAAWTVARVQETLPIVAKIVQHHKAHSEFLFHDYYALCPTINLLTPKSIYCGLPEDNGCDSCALRGKSFSMKKWRNAWNELLSVMDEIVFFSENTRNNVSKIYSLDENQIIILPHKIEIFGQRLKIPTKGPMRIAVVGIINKHKGANIVLSLAKLLEKRMPEANIVIFGRLEEVKIPPNILELGPYKREELATLLEEHKITIGFFPSVCPETFSFVVRELGSLGLPLVSFNLGAQGDYVSSLTNGQVAPEMNAESAFEALLKLDSLRTNTAIA